MNSYATIIFGGTFDPVHVGHLGIAREIAQKLSVPRVLLLPTAGNPLKHQAHASAGQRLEMLTLATAGDELFEICDYELFQAPPTYTIETMERLAAAGRLDGGAGFVIGADSLKELHRWRRADELLAMVDLIVAARPPEDFSAVLQKINELEDRFGLDMVTKIKRNTVKTQLYDVSSTEIRNLAAAGKPLGGLVVPAVEEFIVKNRIYSR